MASNTLETDKVTAHYDYDRGLLFVTYRGVMTPDVTMTFYRWLGELIEQSGDAISAARGSVYDFRQVTNFASSNISSAQRQSQQLNTKVDLSNIPVALITESALQTEWVRVTMKISPGQTRKRIVKSMDEAMDFFDEFRDSKAAVSASSDSAPAEAVSTAQPAPVPVATGNAAQPAAPAKPAPAKPAAPRKKRK